MSILTISHAKARLSRITRSVVRTRKAVIIRAPAGLVELRPYDLPEPVPYREPGYFEPDEEAIRQINGARTRIRAHR